MLDDALPWLRCPHCHRPLRRDGGALGCPQGHRFDLARQGYASLRSGSSRSRGDTTAMVLARERALAAGHLAAITTAVTDAATARLADGPPGAVVDLGAGTGHHLASVLRACPQRAGIALEVAPAALRRAARAHPRLAAVGCDVWERLPLTDDAAAAVLNVFAPRNPAEMQRVCHRDGVAIVVTPTPAHLAELVAPLGLLSVDQGKESRLRSALEPHFALLEQREVSAALLLDRAAAHAIVTMGPSAHHVDEDDLADRLAACPEPIEATAAVEVRVLRPLAR
ncbi:MAG: putative RNA methyltransferase [Actinomycetota bacterium]